MLNSYWHAHPSIYLSINLYPSIYEFFRKFTLFDYNFFDNPENVLKPTCQPHQMIKEMPSKTWEWDKRWDIRMGCGSGSSLLWNWVVFICSWIPWNLSFSYILFHEKRLQTMLWHHNARVNSHQRWKQTRFRICFRLWCELTSTMNVTEWQVSWNSCIGLYLALRNATWF